MEKPTSRKKDRIHVPGAVLWCVGVLTVALSGCIDTATTTLVSAVSASSFSGATSAVNINSTQIKISWTGGNYSVGSNPAASYRVFEQLANGNLSSVAKVALGNVNYTVNVSAGTFHSYVVQVFDAYGNSDGNLNAVSAIAYGGISAITSVGTNGVLLIYPSSTDAIQLDAYCKFNGQAYTLVADLSASSTSATISGLNSGTNYTCKVLALSPAELEDQNTATATAQTTSLSSTQYQGVMLAQALGPAPNAPTTPAVTNLSGSIIGTNANPVVSITWPQFTGYSPSNPYSYAVVRTGHGNPIDMTTTAPCTATTTSSCLVCTVNNITGAAGTCQDGMKNGAYTNTVGVSPQQYDYAVTRIVNGVVEQLPSSNDLPYRIFVPIPPSNMVLVHRDSVNYEMCLNLLGRSPQPLNHQACTYAGIGALPINSGSSVFSNTIKNPQTGLAQSGVYDFGYNLFVDRWEAACNWTNDPVCGSSGCVGQTNGGTPTVSGNPGDVFYDTGYGVCFVYSGGWKNVENNLGTIPPSYIWNAANTGAYTNAPSQTYRKPPLTNIDQSSSYGVCQEAVDPFYGARRLMRRREFVAAAGWPTFTGEPGALSDAQITQLQNGYISTSHSSGYNYCNSDVHDGVTPPATFNSNEYAGNSSTNGSIGQFTIGSAATSACVSRFGAQDLVGNVNEWSSDQYHSCTGSYPVVACQGIASDLETANTDLQLYNFDNVTGPDAVPYGYGMWSGSNAEGGGESGPISYFAPTVGLPFVTDTDNWGGTPLTIGSGIPSAKLHNDSAEYYLSAGTSIYAYANGGASSWSPNEGFGGTRGQAGRFSFILGSQSIYGTSSQTGFRCALPAE